MQTFVQHHLEGQKRLFLYEEIQRKKRPLFFSMTQFTPTPIPPKHFSLETSEELVGETTPDLTCLRTHRVQELLQVEFSSVRLTLQGSLSHCMQDVHDINQAMPSGSRQHCSPCCCIPRGPSVVRAASLAQPKGSICA